MVARPAGQAMLDDLAARSAQLHDQGLYKHERVIASPQSAHIDLADDTSVLNFCANNYLGLADHPALIEAARSALDTYGYGMASVRFICGTQTVHRDLEYELSGFLGTDDTILYSSCFDANGGLFETILGEGEWRPAIVDDDHRTVLRHQGVEVFTNIGKDFFEFGEDPPGDQDGADPMGPEVTERAQRLLGRAVAFGQRSIEVERNGPRPSTGEGADRSSDRVDVAHLFTLVVADPEPEGLKVTNA